MKEIKAIIQPFMLDKVLTALTKLGDLPGLSMSRVSGWGKARAQHAKQTHSEAGHRFADKVKLEIVVADDVADNVIETITRVAHTGNIGDGKIFVIDVAEAVKIRTGARGEAAL